MNQTDLFPADPPAATPEHGGYAPPGKHIYRGHLVPATYLEQQGMRVVQKPTMLWLMDEILSALVSGPVLRRDLHDQVGAALDHGTLSRHVHLLAEMGLLEIDYRFGEPRDRGGSDPAVVQLPEPAITELPDKGAS